MRIFGEGELVKRRSPQEKKQLSYAKDRRNDYGANDKSSRKNIPLRKRAPHRANRRRTHQTLEAAAGAVDELAEEAAEERLLATRPKSWKKWRDALWERSSRVALNAEYA
ncbi:hypothetical protein [Nonomuraea aurantiaca]|uniref:hypothetical protein n=1 Tax=Nonomuraea aurantiaca TaxID=2878562 RepID=UPI001CD91C1A|nr:hypothetical protein [Nonomuraea aurantiaca]MCA2227046.1 hypothetical protein [Nonomuraea aurantiaca]